MTTLAIIGGTGLTRMEGLTVTRREMVKTPYGAPSCPIVFGELEGRQVAFLARHGSSHRIPPHHINYCANIWALHNVGIKQIFAVGAVGGISDDCAVGSMVIPDQIIDYTQGRENTFYDGGDDPLAPVDFSYPYNETLRSALIDGANSSEGLVVVDRGVYGVTQGPRWETAAEIRRMANDGCTIVGKTGMPEASLAAELGLDYACCGVVVNPVAGRKEQPVQDKVLPVAMGSAINVLRRAVQSAVLAA